MEEKRAANGGEKPYLSEITVWAIAFGCMVGWGVFAMPGTTFLPAAGPAGTVIAMIAGTAIMLVVGRNLSFLMARSPMTGGIYAYTKETFGRDHAFLSAWFLCLSYLTIVFLNGTAFFIVIRTLLADSLRGQPHYNVAGNEIYVGETVVSILALAGIGILFVVAKPLLRRLQTIFAVILLGGIVIMAAACLPAALRSGQLWSFGTMQFHPAYGIFSVMILAPWAFVGFEVVSFDTADFKFPTKKSGKLLAVSIVLAGCAYTFMTLVAVAALPEGYGSWQAYIGDLGNLSGVISVPTFYAAKTLLGAPGVVIMTVTAVAAIMTGIIGGYRATVRVLTTMAEDRILSEAFSKTSVSIVFIMGLSILLSLLGRNTLNWFVDLTSFGAIVAFGYTSAAAGKIGRTEGVKSVAATGTIGLVISVVFGIVQIVPRITAFETMGSEAFLLLSLWCLLGFLFYFRTVTKSNLTEYSRMSTSGVILFSLLLYAAVMWIGKKLMAAESLDEAKGEIALGGFFMLLIIFVGLAVMLFVQNVVRKKYEELERDKIRAVESSLAKSQFLFNMSHDIRTPMNAIIGYTNLAMKEDSPEEMRSFLRKIDDSSRHLLTLINDILEMSRIESGQIELELVPTDLCAVFDGMRDLFAEQMREKQMDFRVHTGQVRHRYVWCDRKNLNRVLLNILSNAYKFTPEGGMIKALLFEAGSRNPEYGSYEIRIEDSGIGMSKAFADKMFDAFERERTTTVSKVEGTGLGLTITKNIIDLMDGTIEVMTSPGNGTVIIVRLKMKLAEEKDVLVPEAAAAEENVSVPHEGKRVLLVEDNMVNMEIARMILDENGFTVETAEDGQIAVDMVTAADAGYYDLVLMDIQMPNLDGYGATRAIRGMSDPAKAAVPIVAMTANAFKEDREAALAAGMQDHIAKPVDVELMLQTIDRVLLESMT